MTLARCPSGVPGFDPLCEGGFIRDRTYAVEGISGAGKSIFALQFLVNGAVQFNEPGILLATEERPQLIRENASTFGWDLRKLEDGERLAIIDGSSTKIGVPTGERFVDVMPFDVDAAVDQFISIQEEIHARRAVIDSGSAIGYGLNDPAKFRLELLKMSTTLQMLEMTTLLTTEVQRSETRAFGVESFVAEGLIELHYFRSGALRVRGVEVIKMRGSSHSTKITPLDITRQGIVVHPQEEI